MNQKSGTAVGLMFFTVGLALTAVFRDRYVGMAGGLLFIIAGIVLLVKSRANKT